MIEIREIVQDSIVETIISKEKELLNYVSATTDHTLTSIVVEGYDGVGKGRVLSILSSLLGSEPYRPDYNFWENYDHRKEDRWKISGFFWDVYRHFFNNYLIDHPMLFDRGVISGAVYNHDTSIALNYKKLLGDANVLHILVMCDNEDYVKFAQSRGNSEPIDLKKFKEYNEEYLRCMRLSGVDYIIYKNNYDSNLSNSLENSCEGCAHYNHGWCRHPLRNERVDKNDYRCALSKDKEVQDK